MWQKFGEAGFLGVTADEEYGGLAMGYQAHCVIMEEMSRASGMSRFNQTTYLFELERDIWIVIQRD